MVLFTNGFGDLAFEKLLFGVCRALFVGWYSLIVVCRVLFDVCCLRCTIGCVMCVVCVVCCFCLHDPKIIGHIVPAWTTRKHNHRMCRQCGKQFLGKKRTKYVVNAGCPILTTFDDYSN